MNNKPEISPKDLADVVRYDLSCIPDAAPAKLASLDEFERFVMTDVGEAQYEVPSEETISEAWKIYAADK